MEEIIPVEDKLKQQRYCLLMGVDFDISLMAYAVIKNGAVMALCQFKIFDRVCSIRGVAIDNGLNGTYTPAMLLRSVVHFADRCQCEIIRIENHIIDKKIVYFAGFSESEDGSYTIDLQKFGQ